MQHATFKCGLRQYAWHQQIAIHATRFAGGHPDRDGLSGSFPPRLDGLVD